MNQTNNLSNRLMKIATYLPKGSFFADIGSDHAYLPCYVCELDPTARAIAGEVNLGPYESAQTNIKSNQLEERIDVRLGDGLAVIHDGEVTEIVIAGMGGSLIKQILDQGHNKLSKVRRIIAQPNIAAPIVRSWFYDHDYVISKEAIIDENNHIYEIIVADKKTDPTPYTLSEKELFFGPWLLKEKSAAFIKKWKHEKNKYYRIIEQMKAGTEVSKEKIAAFETELAWIEEVLSNGEMDE